MLTLPEFNFTYELNFPHVVLPRLNVSTFRMAANSNSLPLAFSASPLRWLDVRMIEENGEVEDRVDAVTEAVLQHRETLETLEVSTFADDLVVTEEAEEALARLKEISRGKRWTLTLRRSFGRQCGCAVTSCFTRLTSFKRLGDREMRESQRAGLALSPCR